MATGEPWEDPGWLPSSWPYDINRIDFAIDEFLALLWNRGVRAMWQSVSPCPCLSGTNQSGRFNCPVCSGFGREVVAEQRVRVAVTGIRRAWQPFNAKMNVMEPGEAVFTVRGEHAPAHGDRLVLEDARIRIAESVKRAKTGYIDRLRAPITEQVVDKTLSLTRGAATEEVTLDVIHCRKQDANGLGGDLMVKDTDFEITADGYIDWTIGGSGAPTAGQQYSIVYVTKPSFIVTDQPHMVRDQRILNDTGEIEHFYLPVNFRARLEWLMQGRY